MDIKLPVAIVAISGQHEFASGSDAVLVVRKFLEKALNETPGSNYNLDTLGPSPFHADFRVTPRSGEKSPEDLDITTEEIQRPGYNDFNITYNENHNSPQKIFDDIFDFTYDDFEAFYRIRQVDVMLSKKWRLAQQVSADALHWEAGAGFFSAMLGFRKQYALFREAMMKLADLEMSYSSAKQSLRQMMATRYFSEILPLRRYCEKEISNFAEFPSHQLRDIVMFQKEQRHHVDILLISLVSAIIGGAVGSLITFAI